MYRIAFATSRDYALLIPSEREFVLFAQTRGISIQPAVWNDPDIKWESFDAVVIRSCWDYYLHAEEFTSWLDCLDSKNITLWNPSGQIRRNMHKFYLRELSFAGYPVVPTIWLEQGEDADIASILDSRGWNRAVIKPAVSAGAHETHLVQLLDTDRAEQIVRRLLPHSSVLVQKYIDEINDPGEWSLVFFNNRYSHAVLKRPASGDFRVQVHHGGSTTAGLPPRAVLNTAQSIIDLAGSDILYARVDGVLSGNSFQLMELELIEPELFLDTSPHAFENFASALLERLNRDTGT